MEIFSISIIFIADIHTKPFTAWLGSVSLSLSFLSTIYVSIKPINSLDYIILVFTFIHCFANLSSAPLSQRIMNFLVKSKKMLLRMMI